MNHFVTRPLVKHLRYLQPLHRMSEDALIQISKYCELIQLSKGTKAFQRSEMSAAHQLFLIEGQLMFRGANNRKQLITGGATGSQLPLPTQEAIWQDAYAISEVTILRIRKAVLDTIVEQRQARRDAAHNAAAQIRPQPEDPLRRLNADISRALAAHQLELPTMPDISVRIARHLEDPHSDSDSIARIIQMDPALTARLIQVSNSCVFGSRFQVNSCRDAVTRLGRRATRDLVTGFVLHNVFRPTHPELKKRLQKLWQHSTQVAAICHALSRKLGVLDPNQALLAGLVHDIGVIPILNLARNHAEIINDSTLLEQMIKIKRRDCCRVTLTNYGFDESMVRLAMEAEDWDRQGTATADYTDLVILAQIHSYVGTPLFQRLPRLDQLPAFRKLDLGELSPRFSIQLLDEADKEIREVQGLFL